MQLMKRDTLTIKRSTRKHLKVSTIRRKSMMLDTLKSTRRMQLPKKLSQKFLAAQKSPSKLSLLQVLLIN